MSNPTLDLNPGPLVEDVLFLKKEHLAYKRFRQGDSPDLAFGELRRGDRGLWTYLEKIHIHPAVEALIAKAGFGGILACGYQQIDMGFVTALVERWRPETHTFHLPVGEATVTLQDINVLLALPIEGAAISFGPFELDREQVYNRVCYLLGFMPDDSDFKKGSKTSLKFSSIRKFLMNNILPHQPTEIEVHQHARCIILHILGGSLFNNTDNSAVSVQFLDLLVDLHTCKQYSWGSAVLAWLYRCLCKGCLTNDKDLTGPMWIVQIWGWSRIRSLGPTIVLRRHEKHDLTLPFAARYVKRLSFAGAPTHSVSAIRWQIQSLQSTHFDWLPYDKDIASLPAECRSGIQSWLSECFLVFWEVAEFHAPSRVLRQFGITQNIPRSIDIPKQEHKKLHQMKKTGAKDIDWRVKHARYIQSWVNRHHTRYQASQIPDAPPLHPGYLEWYRSRTVKYIIDPRRHHIDPPSCLDVVGLSQIMLEEMTQIHQRTTHLLGPDVSSEVPPEYRHDLENIHNIAGQLMGYSGEWGMSQHPSHLQTSSVDLSDFEPRRHRERMNHRNDTHDAGGASGSQWHGHHNDVGSNHTQTTFVGETDTPHHTGSENTSTGGNFDLNY